VLIVELKSEAVKERHWKRLMRQLRVSWVLPDLTLGHLWDIDLVKNEVIVKDVLLVAQGEMALEEFLKQVCNAVTCLISVCELFDLQKSLVSDYHWLFTVNVIVL